MVPLPMSSNPIARAENPNILLGKSPERDRELDAICQMIRNASKAGIPSLKYNLTLLGVPRTESTPGRGGARYSTFVYDQAKQDPPLTEAGVVGEEVYWDRITYFLKRVIPVAEEYKVRMACHPQDPGMRVNLPRTTYNTGVKSKAFYERLLPVIGAMPGLQAVAISSGVPLSGGNTGTELSFPGRTLATGVPTTADWRVVDPGYFRSMSIPLRGRDFDDRDVGTESNPAQLVTIISESMAKRYWPNEDPIGRSVIIHSFAPKPYTIIGVAGDVRSFGLDVDVGPMVYASYMVHPGWNPMSLVIRSAGDPLSHVESIRTAIREIDPTVPIYDIRSLDDLLSQSFGSRRFNMAEPAVGGEKPLATLDQFGRISLRRHRLGRLLRSRTLLCRAASALARRGLTVSASSRGGSGRLRLKKRGDEDREKQCYRAARGNTNTEE